MLFGIFLAAGMTHLYPLKVGGQGLVNGAPTVVMLFEMTMLGLMASAFVGVFLDSAFPNYKPKEYVREISDGKIAIMFTIAEDKESDINQMLTSIGAISVTPAERQML
jgi:hypothetical protein